MGFNSMHTITLATRETPKHLYHLDVVLQGRQPPFEVRAYFVGIQRFDTYEAALAYMEAQP